MQWRAVGLEPLAIVYSLTYALLMWSYVIYVLIFDLLYRPDSLKQRVGVLRCPCDI